MYSKWYSKYKLHIYSSGCTFTDLEYLMEFDYSICLCMDTSSVYFRSKIIFYFVHFLLQNFSNTLISSSKNLPNKGDTISITKLIIIWERGYAVESALKPRIDMMSIGVAICITPGNTAKITEYAMLIPMWRKNGNIIEQIPPTNILTTNNVCTVKYPKSSIFPATNRAINSTPPTTINTIMTSCLVKCSWSIWGGKIININTLLANANDIAVQYIKKVGLFMKERYALKISISFFRMPNFGLRSFVSLFVSSLTAVCRLKHFGWRNKLAPTQIFNKMPPTIIIAPCIPYLSINCLYIVGFTMVEIPLADHKIPFAKPRFFSK